MPIVPHRSQPACVPTCLGTSRPPLQAFLKSVEEFPTEGRHAPFALARKLNERANATTVLDLAVPGDTPTLM